MIVYKNKTAVSTNKPSLTALHFLLNWVDKPGERVVMYLYTRGIDFVYFYDFSIGFWKYSTV